MKILIIGGGGREDALAWKISQSPLADRIYCMPGNGGIGQIAECVPGDPGKVAEVAEWAEKQGIGLTVVGPELPLTQGIVDEFSRRGMDIFGPNRAAAQIEGSKVFMKQLLKKYGIPTADFRIFDDPGQAKTYISGSGSSCVVKADGLAAGKGVYVCQDTAEANEAVTDIMERRIFGEAGDHVIVEECLVGEEASFLAFTDGQTVIPMIASQDHKRIYDGDRGPNTGGMGAYSPAGLVTPEMAQHIIAEIMQPTVRAMAQEGCPYKGVLYAGLMICHGKPYVLEFNARFGDPETQSILPLLETDLVEVMQAVIHKRLSQVQLEWRKGAAVCIVLASGGYPGDYQKGKLISGLDQAQGLKDVLVFHAGTVRKDGNYLTSGGRVLGVVGRGDDLPKAISAAYAGAGQICFEDMHYRRDIGQKGLKYGN